MAGYLEDLVQNIYTNCDMSGLDKLNQGLQDAIWYSGELERNLKDAQNAQKEGFNFHAQAINKSKEAYKVESLRQRLEYEQANFRKRLNEQQEIIDERKQHRQEQHNAKLSEQNVLLKRAGQLLLTYFSFRTLKGMVETGSRLQLIQKSIEGLTKSTQDWDFIQTQAFKTGTDIEIVARGYRNFFSSARMAGFSKEGIQGLYADLLLSTRAIGATTQQTEGALLALEQMISKGTVSMEELRRQLGNALPGAFEIGAKAMNMTTMEFNNFVRKGQLASVEFVPKFIEQLKKEYANGFKEISETVDFASHNLKNAWKMLQFEIVHGKAGKEIAKLINIVTKFVQSPTLLTFIRTTTMLLIQIGKVLGFIVEHIQLLLPLLAPASLYALAYGLTFIAKGFINIMKAMMGVELAIGGMNIGLVAFIKNALIVLSLVLALEEALKGFPTLKRIWTQYQANKDYHEQLQKPSVKNNFRQVGKDVYFNYGGKTYHMEGHSSNAPDFNKFDANGGVVNAWKKYYVDTGKAREIIPLPPNAGGEGRFMEKNENNTYDIKIIVPEATSQEKAQMTGEIIGEKLSLVLNGLIYS